MNDPTVYNFRALITDYDLKLNFFVNAFVRQFVYRTISNVMQIISGMDDAPSKEKRRNTRVTRSLSLWGIEWPTCDTLDHVIAFDCIHEEMQKWNELPELREWMFNVEFLNLRAINHGDLYTYEVIWSVPTAAYPVPQVTVSVFFNVTANFDDPPHYPPEVTYTFEFNQFVHRLNMIFQPKWLYDILDLKTMVFQSLKA